MGPVANSAETYPWYALPFCQPPQVGTAAADFGDSLSGDRKVNTLYQLKFKQDEEMVQLCTKKLSEDDIVRGLRRAQRCLPLFFTVS